jgi:hypothetical protein
MSELNLQAQAQKYFGFLVTNRGYRCIDSNPYRISLESPQAFIDIAFDGRRSYELELSIGKKKVTREGCAAYTLSEVLRLKKAPEAKRLSLVQVTTIEALSSFLKAFADALSTYGSDLIDGDEESFLRLEEQRYSEVAAYALERDLRIARNQADEAWRRKDYAAVIKAFDPVRAALTPAEVKKLELAEAKEAPDSGT